MTVTRQRVADLTGVSPATVPKAFSRPWTVRPATREQPMATAAKCRDTLDKAASALRRNGSENIVLLNRSPLFRHARVHGLFQAQAVNAVLEAINPSPYALVVRSCHNSEEFRRELWSANGDGIILLHFALTPERTALLRESSRPVVCYPRQCTGPPVNRVLTDQFRVGRTAGLHVLKTWPRRVLVICVCHFRAGSCSLLWICAWAMYSGEAPKACWSCRRGRGRAPSSAFPRASCRRPLEEVMGAASALQRSAQRNG